MLENKFNGIHFNNNYENQPKVLNILKYIENKADWKVSKDVQ